MKIFKISKIDPKYSNSPQKMAQSGLREMPSTDNDINSHIASLEIQIAEIEERLSFLKSKRDTLILKLHETRHIGNNERSHNRGF